MAKREIESWMSGQDFVGDESVGARIFADSLEAPIRKIISNAGVDASLIVGKLLDGKSGQNTGYNVLKR